MHTYGQANIAQAIIIREEFENYQLPPCNVHLSKVCLTLVLTPFTHHLVHAMYIL